MNRSSRIVGAAITAVFLASAAACSSSTSGGTPPSSPTGPTSSMSANAPGQSNTGQSNTADTITISNFKFDMPASVAPGATITVTNKDSVEHTVTADSGGAFDVTVQAGATATFKAPSAAGSYPFHCTVHPFMHGTLVVSGS